MIRSKSYHVCSGKPNLSYGHVANLLHVYRVIDRLCDSLHDSIRRRSLVKEFRLEELPQLSAKFDKLLTLLLVLITQNIIFILYFHFGTLEAD